MTKQFMAANYIFRLDDVCPTMNWTNFDELEKLFTKFGVKPIMGIVPDNQDQKLMVQSSRDNFWAKMKELSCNGWVIAQHGYQHVYVNKLGGILNINSKSEFAGLSYEEQMKKIRRGREILEKNL